MCPRYRSAFLVCLAALMLTLGIPSFTASAQEPSSEPHRIEEIRVVASPIIEGNELDRYASQKTTVSEEQVADLNAQDLASALRKTPGVNISRYNPIGSFGGAEGGGIFIRGQGSSRPGAEIKTLVDGVPMFMSVWNHPLLDLMSIGSAHSVEVYKSPQPQHFGNAYAVVNIVPKRIEKEGFTTRLQAAGGSNGTFITSGDHGGKKGLWDYQVGGSYRASDGDRADSDGQLTDAHGRLGYQLTSNWNLSAFSLWNDNYSRDPGQKGADPALRQGKYETRSLMAVATAENRYDNAEGYIKLYRNEGEGDWLDQPLAGGVKEDLFNDFLFYGAKARETFRIWQGGEIITGLDWDVSEGDYRQEYSNGRRDAWDGERIVIVSPYASASYLIGSKDAFFLIPSAGARYYGNDTFDAEWAPHAGIVAGYKATEFHAGYARAIIYPGLDVIVFSEKVLPALRDTWKDVDAEKVDHYEAGIRQRFGTMAMADLTFFYDDGQDRYVVDPPPPPPPTYANIESYRTRGIEATLTLYPAKNLALFGGVTVLDPDPSDLPYAPELTVSAGLNWRFLENFKLSADCQYVDDFFAGSQARRLQTENTEEVDRYFLVNAKLSYLLAFMGQGVNAELFVAGENLTDADYEYRPGYPMPGINGMAGIQLQF